MDTVTHTYRSNTPTYLLVLIGHTFFNLFRYSIDFIDFYNTIEVIKDKK